jgi:hypothetical protein
LLCFQYACLGRLFPCTRFLCCNYVLQVRLALVPIGRMFPSVHSRVACSGEAVPQHKTCIRCGSLVPKPFGCLVGVLDRCVGDP